MVNASSDTEEYSLSAAEHAVGVGKTDSGMVVAPGIVATCYHVVQDAIENAGGKGLYVRVGYQGQQLPATVLRAEKAHDLCLLKVDGLDIPPIKLSQFDLAKGDRVEAVSKNASGCICTNPGMVTHINAAAGVPVIFSTAHIDSGCSGGGLVNELEELVGISAYRNNVSIPLQYLQQLLARTDSKYTVSSPEHPTEIDYFLPLAVAEHGIFEHAQQWAEHYPQSYWAALELAQSAKRFSGKDAPNKADDAQICYEAATRLQQMHPSALSLEALADAASCSGRIEEALRTRWTMLESQRGKNEILAAIFKDSKRLPTNEREMTLELIISAADRLKLRDFDKSSVYCDLAEIAITGGPLEIASGHIAHAISSESEKPAKYTLLRRLLAVLAAPKKHTEEYHTAAMALAKKAIDLVYEDPTLAANAIICKNEIAADLAACLGSPSASANVVRNYARDLTKLQKGG